MDSLSDYQINLGMQISLVVLGIPLFCWLSLIFMIPLEILLPIYAIELGESPSYLDINNNKMLVVWSLWILIPFAFIFAIFGEIFLIPSFFFGVISFWAFVYEGLSIYIL